MCVCVCVCVCRFALVDFGLAQGTADTHIELLKVVRQRTLQKGGGSTGKQDTAQQIKAPPRLLPKAASTASTSRPLPAQPSTNLPPSSSSSTTSSSASQKALVKKARSVPTTVTTSRTKHTKDLTGLRKVPRPVFGERNLNSCTRAPSATKQVAIKTELKLGKTDDPATRRCSSASRGPLPARTPNSSQRPPRTVQQGLTCNCYLTDRVCNICLSR
ncbi:Cell division cycle 7-related protein kinase [Liparis tanakae]|uniref:Cell division cycle 7-related protein kinase n=1 Tax=Liparis tanakae TaxID=230148 RepID=A0A4Z2HWX5_9TELE|nr:Cell division cycle 7-related protein kinase [Liparis tanakae]